MRWTVFTMTLSPGKERDYLSYLSKVKPSKNLKIQYRLTTNRKVANVTLVCKILVVKKKGGYSSFMTASTKALISRSSSSLS
jgi:hypothetical protein